MTIPNTPDYTPTQYVDNQAPAVDAQNLDNTETGLDALNADVRAIEALLPSYAKLAGATFTGTVLLPADPSANLGAATKQYVDNHTGTGAVSSVNSQTGAVVLTAASVGAVPTATTVNGHALSANVTVTAADVSAVPTTRTINGQALSANITLTAANVGAGTKWNPRTVTTASTAVAADFMLVDTTTATFPVAAPDPAASDAGAEWGMKWTAGSTAPTVVGVTATYTAINETKTWISNGTAWVSASRQAIAQAADFGTVVFGLANLPAGASFEVESTDGTNWTFNGATITSRPSARTDIRMYCWTTGTTAPSFALTGDKLFKLGA